MRLSPEAKGQSFNWRGGECRVEAQVWRHRDKKEAVWTSQLKERAKDWRRGG